MKFINNNNLICENQIGFKEKCRTTDHIFTIKSIFDVCKTKKKKVFTEFIDQRLRSRLSTKYGQKVYFINFVKVNSLPKFLIYFQCIETLIAKSSSNKA